MDKKERNSIRKAKLKALRSEIQKGLDDLEAGFFKDGRKTMVELRNQLMQRNCESNVQRI